MRSLRKNQLGFGLVETAVLILVIVVVAGGGWLLYNHNHKKNVNDATGSSSQTSTKSTLPSNNAQTAQQAQQYVSIKEWGIQIPLTDTIKDAYYVVSTSTKDANGQPNTVWLGLTSLNSSGCDASQANQGQSTQLGAILRVSPTDTDPVSGTPYTQLYPNGATIGNYYYAYKSYTKNKTCTSQSNLTSIDSAFATAVKNATATTN